MPQNRFASMDRMTGHPVLNWFRATLMAGLFLILPFGVLFFLAFQVWKLMRQKMYTLTDALGVGSELRLTTALLLAVIIITLIALVAGTFVRAKAEGKRHHFVERNLLRLLPGYSLMRMRLAEKIGQRSSRIPALLRTVNGLQPVMIMEQDPLRALVFLPQVPGASSGSLVIVELSSLEALDVDVMELDDHLYAMGNGLLDKVPASVRPGGSHAQCQTVVHYALLPTETTPAYPAHNNWRSACRVPHAHHHIHGAFLAPRCVAMDTSMKGSRQRQTLARRRCQ